MSSSTLLFEAPRRLRAYVRARETSIILLAALTGIMGGLVVVAMSYAVDLMHVTLFGVAPGQRLSASFAIDPMRAVIPALGGIVLGLWLYLLARWRPDGEIDPIEANALHGGRMSFRGSVIVAGQVVLSSGAGASVGLEAGYTQLASGLSSWLGRMFHLRRNDLRLLVGCGAASAIAGAFGSPLGGAFYAFELIIGGYTPVGLAPVGIAALIGYLVAHAFEPTSLGIIAGNMQAFAVRDLAIAAVLGVLAALFGIVLMHGVALCERLMVWLRVPILVRPAIGGVIVGGLALFTPQVMASGHGALHLTAMLDLPLAAIGMILLFKATASIVSLGCGFRGGLFFATLLLGAMGGRLFANLVDAAQLSVFLDPDVYAVLGLAALPAAVIGSPLAMTFIVLESTGDFWLTTAVLIAVIVSNWLTREWFGYSFATWRFHLRGETIRGAADIGWIRDLTVGRMMRGDVETVSKDISIENFRKLIPLGSTTLAVAVDQDNRYAGLVFVPDIYAADHPEMPSIEPLLRHRHTMLVPVMSVRDAAHAFENAEAEALAVVDSFAEKKVIGLLTEAHVLRRYAGESERRRREMSGEV